MWTRIPLHERRRSSCAEDAEYTGRYGNEVAATTSLPVQPHSAQGICLVSLVTGISAYARSCNITQSFCLKSLPLVVALVLTSNVL